MLNYKLSARQNPSDREAASKVYASVVSSGHLTMEMICANIERNSTATRGDVKGVALAFANGIAKSLANGNSVYLEDLGIFPCRHKIPRVRNGKNGDRRQHH